MTMTDERTDINGKPLGDRVNNRPPQPSSDIQDEYVGKTFLYRVETLSFMVRVKAVRNRFGHIDALVSPVAGSGEKWVQASRLSR